MNMKLRTRTKGTNQYMIQGKLDGVKICKNCNGFVPSYYISTSTEQPFPVKTITKNCPKCGGNI